MGSPSFRDPRTIVLVVGVVAAVLVGTLFIAVLLPGSSGTGGPTGTGGSVSVYAHGWGVGNGEVSPTSGGPASVYGHTYGIVGSTTTTAPGPLSVYNHVATVGAGPTVSTPSMSVPIGSAVFVFVGYSNALIGGATVTSVMDSLGDSYSLVTSTGFAENHTEDLYVAEPLSANASLIVSVTFSGGATVAGGSVAAIDVTGPAIPFVDGIGNDSGSGGLASVSFTTRHSNDLVLYAFSGQEKDTPFSPTSTVTPLDTGNGTSGPFENGESYATYSATEVGMSAGLSATLATPAVWNAIGVGLVGCNGCFSSASTTTPAFQVERGSLVFAFLGYANALSGGAVRTAITDSLGDSYSLVVTTGLAENHTETLYVAGPIPINATVSVTANFSGGEDSNGGSVGVVDVAGAGQLFVDGVNDQSGSGVTASVSVSTSSSNDLLLLGLSGPAEDTPFAPTSGETPLDSINDTGAPSGTAVGFATYSSLETGASADLSAKLASSGVWNAIGVGIGACPDCASQGGTNTSPFSVAAGSSVFVFVGFVNAEIGGGEIGAITDTAGDSYFALSSTGFAENHSEELFVSEPIHAATTLAVSVTMTGGSTAMGCAVAAIDVVGSDSPAADGIVEQSADGAFASVTLTTGHANDLVLLGISGQQRDAPFAPTSGETLLDTTGNTTGPFEDGEGFGTFAAVETGNTISLSSTLANPAVWVAIAVGISEATSPSGATAAPGPNAAVANGLGLTLAPPTRES